MAIQFRFLIREKFLIGELHAKYHDEHNANYSVNHIQEEMPMVVVADAIV